jgi:cation-transporting ATPase 13A1
VVLKRQGQNSFFEFQHRRYDFDSSKQEFRKLRYPDEEDRSFYYGKAIKGLSSNEVSRKLQQYGANKLQVPMPSFWELYKEQITSPLFAFQVFCVILWCLDEMWKYSLMTLGMMLSFEATVVRSRQRSLRELRGMRTRPYPLLVLRDGKWQPVFSDQLVPLDIVWLSPSPGGMAVPCDILLLSGRAVVNESMLTGESVPLMKEALRAESLEVLQQTDMTGGTLQPRNSDKIRVIFGGTTLLQCEDSQLKDENSPVSPGPGCLGCVLRTGFGSAQGKLLRTIMFSTQAVSANNRESFFCIMFLLIFAVLASVYVLYHGLHDYSRSRYELLLHCILIITSVIPPELPMQLSLAVQSSLVDLAKQGVFCTEPFRIPFAGMLDICCFDKTGTLTVDKLHFSGIQDPQSDKMLPAEKAPISSTLVLAACHSLVSLGGKPSGDPIEVASFDAIGWHLHSNDIVHARNGKYRGTRVQIVVRHAFDASLQRMSVVAQVEGEKLPEQSSLYVLAKGSPESIKDCLRDAPPDYDQRYKKLAMEGMRVIALALKELPAELVRSEAGRLKRSAVESGLDFAGFASFRCPPRNDSRFAIKMLRSAEHRVAMITGDALLTALHVALETGICSRRKKNLVLARGSQESGIDGFFWIKPSHFAQGKLDHGRRFVVEDLPELVAECNLAITGDVLNEFRKSESQWRSLLLNLRVFARMIPSQKETVITDLKDAGLYCLMCGDGTNDVGALKQAHVGVALLQSSSSDQTVSTNLTESEIAVNRNALRQETRSSRERYGSNQSRENANNRQLMSRNNGSRENARSDHDLEMPVVRLGDASIASPFTSKWASIISCVGIIRQGRCTLVTTLQMYQILALNCLISAYSLSVLYLEGVKFGDRQMTVTGILIAIAFYYVSRSRPLKKLAPHQPPRSMFTPSLLLSLLGQFAIHLGALVFATMLSKSYLPADYLVDLKGDFKPNILNTIIFLLSTTQQVSVFLANYKGEPFMQSIRKNRPLLYSLLSCATLMLVASLELLPDLNQYMELVPLPDWPARFKVFFLLVGDFSAVWIWDILVRQFWSFTFRKTR